MRVLGLAIVLGLALSAQAQDFKSARRFDKSAESIVTMGHDEWIKFFCDDSRVGKDGRIEGEKVYCLALHELNQARLKTLSKKEQDFYSGAFSYFADLAKTSFGIGMALSSNKDAWALPIAESSTAINEAFWKMLTPSQRITLLSETANIDYLSDRIEDAAKGQEQHLASDSKRYRAIAKNIEAHFANRSGHEKAVAKRFVAKMGHMALLRL